MHINPVIKELEKLKKQTLINEDFKQALKNKLIFMEESTKSRTAVVILSGLLGGLGIHRFYIGKVGTGLLMLFTLGGLGIWTMIDFIFAVIGRMKDKEGKLITQW